MFALHWCKYSASRPANDREKSNRSADTKQCTEEFTHSVEQPHCANQQLRGVSSFAVCVLGCSAVTAHLAAACLMSAAGDPHSVSLRPLRVRPLSMHC